MLKSIKFIFVFGFLVIAFLCILLPNHADRGTSEALWNPEIDMTDAILRMIPTLSILFPALLVVESFRVKLPFGKRFIILLAVQFSWALLAWPLLFFHPVYELFGNNVETFFTGRLIQFMCTYSLAWNFLLLIPSARKWKWVSWPFEAKNE